jgi:uncharacterized protein (TIGR03435 family)
MGKLRRWSAMCSATIWLIANPAFAQSQAPAPEPSFEVVSIKPNRTGSGTTVQRMRPTFYFENVTVKTLILFAYNVPTFLVTGGPDWVNTDKFDFAGANSPSTTPSVEDIRAMVRGALTDRFALKARTELKTQSIYVLVRVKETALGDHLRQASIDCASETTPLDVKRDPVRCGLQFERSALQAHGQRLDVLTNYLRSMYRRVVIDKTGLQGPFDFDLKWNRDLAPDSQFPSMEGALQEQLGLKLQGSEGLVETLIIEQVRQPTPD